jgi:hypothetical protein
MGCPSRGQGPPGSVKDRNLSAWSPLNVRVGSKPILLVLTPRTRDTQRVPCISLFSPGARGEPAASPLPYGPSVLNPECGLSRNRAPDVGIFFHPSALLHRTRRIGHCRRRSVLSHGRCYSCQVHLLAAGRGKEGSPDEFASSSLDESVMASMHAEHRLVPGDARDQCDGTRPVRGVDSL